MTDTMVGMPSDDTTPIARLARYWSAKDADDRRELRNLAVLFGAFVAFGLWVSLTPTGIAFISWFAG